MIAVYDIGELNISSIKSWLSSNQQNTKTKNSQKWYDSRCPFPSLSDSRAPPGGNIS
jgi:hypothetical protein